MTDPKIKEMISREATRQDDLRLQESKRVDQARTSDKEAVALARIADKEATALARAADKDAIDIARSDLDRRLEEMNNMRSQIDRERGSFVTLPWFEAKHKEVEQRLTKLEEWQWKVVGGMAVALIVGTIIGWIISNLMVHLK